jgi:hypothetical protein
MSRSSRDVRSVFLRRTVATLRQFSTEWTSYQKWSPVACLCRETPRNGTIRGSVPPWPASTRTSSLWTEPLARLSRRYYVTVERDSSSQFEIHRYWVRDFAHAPVVFYKAYITFMHACTFVQSYLNFFFCMTIFSQLICPCIHFNLAAHKWDEKEGLLGQLFYFSVRQTTGANIESNCSFRYERAYSHVHSWSWAFLEKPPVGQLLKNFPAFYGTLRFITVFTRALHWSLTWARLIQSTRCHPISLRSVLILSTHLRRGLPSDLVPSSSLTNILNALLFSPFSFLPVWFDYSNYIWRNVQVT